MPINKLHSDCRFADTKVHQLMNVVSYNKIELYFNLICAKLVFVRFFRFITEIFRYIRIKYFAQNIILYFTIFQK
jgi:hypothetical protein